MDITWKAHRKPIYQIAFSPCGEKILTSSGDETLAVWSLSSQQKELELPGSRYWSPVAWSGNGRWIARGGYGVKVWNADDGSVLLDSPDFTEAVAFSHNDSVFAIHGNSSNALRRFQLPVFKELAGGWGGVRTNTQFPTGAMAFHPKENILATLFGILPAQGDGFYSVVLLWDETGREIGRLWPEPRPSHHATELAFSKDGQFLVGIYGAALICWELAGGTELGRMQPAKTHFKGLRFAPDGEHAFATNSNKLVYVYHVPSGKEVDRLEPDIGKPGGLDLSPPGDLIAVGGQHGRVRIRSL